MAVSLSARPSGLRRNLPDVDETGLAFLRPGSGIDGVDGQVVGRGPGRQSLEAPVVGHPHGGDFLAVDPQRLHALRDYRLDGDLAAGAGDLDLIAGIYSELPGQFLWELHRRLGNLLVEPGQVAGGRAGAPVLG